MKTADLIDGHAADLTLVHLPFRCFGTQTHIAGPIQCVSCFEDNTLVRAQLETPGQGRVLVVDGGGSTRVALLGDMLAGFGIKNGWQGIIINGAIRDSADIDTMPTCVFALGTSPVKSAKEGWGKVGMPVSFGGVTFEPGGWVYGDADGILYSAKKLS